MLLSWIDTIDAVKALLVTHSAAIGIDPDYILVSNGYGLDTPAPFVMIGAEWKGKRTHNASVAEITLTCRIGAEATSNAEAAAVVMQLINKIGNVMDANGYQLEMVEPLFMSSDRTIFDMDYIVPIKVFNFLSPEEQSNIQSTIMS